jgi:hypothetical protein
MVERLAELELPTGTIVACDPLVGSDGAPAFARTVPAGRYPVDACIAQIEPGLDAGGKPVWLVTDFRVLTAPRGEPPDRVD